MSFGMNNLIGSGFAAMIGAASTEVLILGVSTLVSEISATFSGSDAGSVTESTFAVTFTDLDAGRYSVNVSYDGDVNYQRQSPFLLGLYQLLSAVRFRAFIYSRID